MTHPAQYSPEILTILRDLIAKEEWVHDPFAGTGIRLGQLCDELGIFYTGTDIEEWPDSDKRVVWGDSTQRWSYPTLSIPQSGNWTKALTMTLVTSPVYLNKRLADYANGPLVTTKTKGRRDYGIALGRALDDSNLARFTGKPSRADNYWHFHGLAVDHWPQTVIVNVDSPIQEGWETLLKSREYRIEAVHRAYTKRYRGLANSEIRAEHEVIIVARRGFTNVKVPDAPSPVC